MLRPLEIFYIIFFLNLRGNAGDIITSQVKRQLFEIQQFFLESSKETRGTGGVRYTSVSGPGYEGTKFVSFSKLRLKKKKEVGNLSLLGSGSRSGFC